MSIHKIAGSSKAEASLDMKTNEPNISDEEKGETKDDIKALKYSFSRWEMIHVQVLSSHMYSDTIFIASQHFQTPEFEASFPYCEIKTSVPISLPSSPATKKSPSFCLDSIIVLNEIHRGSIGYVIQVLNTKSQREYGMKIYEKSKISNELTFEKILMEVKVMKMLAAKILYAQLYSTFQTSKSIGLLMEYFSDGNIRRFLNMPRKTSIPQAKVLLAHLAVAIHHLHEMGIIHRDIRPESILVHNETKIKMSNFSCSKFITSEDKTSCGCSHRYLAPEILRNKEHSFEVDWWSFGVVACEVLSGTLPRGNFWEVGNPSLEFLNLETSVSPAANSFVKAFLQVEPKSRLGSGGFTEISSHKFFKGIEWKNIFKLLESSS